MFGRHIDDDDQRGRFSRRALLLGAGQLAAFGAVASKLYQVQVMQGSTYAPMADENRINVQLIAPIRGRIYDRYGRLLAGNDEGFRVVVMPSLAGNVRQVLGRLAQIISVPTEEQEKLVARARRQQPNVPLIVASDLTFEQIATIGLFAPQLPGVQVEAAATRHYLEGDAVAHVVGHVGNVERVAIDDDPVLRLPGMRVGRTGIELGLEERLRGRSGATRYEVDARGRIVRTLSEVAPSRGADIAITLDTGLQRAIGERLRREHRASAVVIDTTSGDVVAMVSMPTHDPGVLVKGASARTWAKLKESGNEQMLNRAIRGLYPPGSTFKMVTALAALEGGLVDPRERIGCEGQIEFGGQVFRCWKRSGHGTCDLHRALRESCDCYFYEIARRLGIDAIAAMGRRLGFGQTYDTGLALQKPGVMPDAAWKRGQFNKPWLGGETLIAGIGQGYVLATPLQLAVMTARIASGRQIVPQFLRPDAGAERARFDPLDVKPAALDAIRKGMVAVVNEDGGTGASVRLDNDQPLVAGKTGTAQVSRASSERDGQELARERRDHALFVTYLPAAAPRYAVSVVVEHGGGGGAVAGPVMRDVIAAVLTHDPAGKPSYPELSGGLGPVGVRGRPA